MKLEVENVLTERENKRLEEIIWAAILKCTYAHAASNPRPNELSFQAKALDFFPTHMAGKLAYKDEHANRFGLMIMNVFYYLNQRFNTQIRIDYKPREEFKLFQTLGHLFSYFYQKFSSVPGIKNYLG